jgi:hypothetical protein
VVGEHELGPAPAAERLALLGRALVRVVAAEAAVADQEGADVAEQLVDRRVGAQTAP